MYQQMVNKNEMVEQITVNTNEIHQENFLEAAVLNCTTKGAIQAPFVEHTFHSLLAL